jgi:hypothetical protein
MTSISRTFGALLLGSLTASGCLMAQQPGKPLNPMPLARPAPITTVHTTDVGLTLREMRDSVVAARFTVTRFDAGGLMVDAKRPDGAGSKSYDRVLVWLQRASQDPLQEVEVYLLYGRYEQMLAGRLDVYRVVVSDHEEDDRVGALRTALGMLTSR